MSRRRGGSRGPSFDSEGVLHVLRDNLGRADAYITAAEDLIERRENDDEDDEDDDDKLSRYRNHVAHLVESAKLAVRAAIYAGAELAKHRPGA